MRIFWKGSAAAKGVLFFSRCILARGELSSYGACPFTDILCITWPGPLDKTLDSMPR